MKVYPMRLCPGVEIKSSLLEFVTSNQLNAAFVLSCCGSVRKATLRFATSADQIDQVCYINTINNNLIVTFSYSMAFDYIFLFFFFSVNINVSSDEERQKNTYRILIGKCLSIFFLYVVYSMRLLVAQTIYC